MSARETLEKIRRIGAAWEELTVLRRRAARTNSRARRIGARGQITADELAEKLAATEGKCSACSKLFGPQRRDRWIICFRVPLSMGGKSDIANINITCRQCEMERAAKLGVKWEGSGRARAARTAPRGSASPRPVEPPHTPPLVFRDDEEENS